MKTPSIQSTNTMMKTNPSRRDALLFICTSLLLACRIARPPAIPATTVPLPTATSTASPTATALPSAPVPTASPTLVSTPTPTATATPKILFQEIFDDELICFNLYNEPDGVKLAIGNGQYLISVGGEENGYYTECKAGFNNFVLEFDTTLQQGNDASLIGIYFRIYTGSTYILWLGGDNTYCLDYYNSDTEEYELIFNCWPATGLDYADTIHVKIVAYGDQIAIHLNDQLAALTFHPSEPYGRLGFSVYNGDPGTRTEILFDNIIVRELSPADLQVFLGEENG